jgi:ribosomal protein RSM22 (predicted rRNA methylase)
MELQSVTPWILEQLEHELVSFIYEDSWQQKWRGEEIPKQVFRSISANARRISDSFTEGRKDIDLHYLRTKEERAAYLLYFHLASTVRILAVLEECARRGLWMDRPIRVLDVGCASAPALWAVRLAQKRFGGELSEVAALDGEKAILPVARKLWERFSAHLGETPPFIRAVRADFRDSRTSAVLRRLGKFDLVIGSNVLNELGVTMGARRLPVIQEVLRENVSADGMLLLIEPALQKTSKDLTIFRDQLISTMKIQTPIPCGHVGQCPLNNEPRDWCNFEVNWTPPPLRRRIERALEHRSGVLRYSYLAIRHGSSTGAADRYRVLSDPLESKRGFVTIVCSSERKLALRFDRKEERVGKVLASVRRGDLLKVSLGPGIGKPRINGYAIEIDPDRVETIAKL